MSDKPAPADDVRVLTYKEVAERLKCHPVTVAKLVRKGAIPCVKGLGRSRRIYIGALRSYLEKQSGLEPVAVASGKHEE